jgi:hypothetical protein
MGGALVPSNIVNSSKNVENNLCKLIDRKSY